MSIYRHELKFLLDCDFRELLDAISCHNQIPFIRSYPSRTVHSLYLDTGDLQFYTAGLTRQLPRKKIRLRWYNHNNSELISPQLEVKINNEQGKSKHIYPASPIAFPISTAHSFNSLLSPVICPQELHPMLIVSYTRHYFSSPNAIYRLTFDCNIHYSLPSAKFKISSPTMQNHNFIMEMKVTSPHAPLHCPLPTISFSKYLEGCRLLYPLPDDSSQFTKD